MIVTQDSNGIQRGYVDLKDYLEKSRDKSENHVVTGIYIKNEKDVGSNLTFLKQLERLKHVKIHGFGGDRKDKQIPIVKSLEGLEYIESIFVSHGYYDLDLLEKIQFPKLRYLGLENTPHNKPPKIQIKTIRVF
jgi:hypothetical protein